MKWEYRCASQRKIILVMEIEGGFLRRIKKSKFTTEVKALIHFDQLFFPGVYERLYSIEWIAYCIKPENIQRNGWQCIRRQRSSMAFDYNGSRCT